MESQEYIIGEQIITDPKEIGLTDSDLQNDDIDYNFDSKNVIHEPYIEKTYDIYGKYNNKLPYKISENEIKKIKYGTQHKLLYRWYSISKIHF